MGEMSLERFLTAISYPDRAGIDGGHAVLLVDESEVIVDKIGGYYRFTAMLDVGEDELVTVASYVPGRIYRDDATLTMDDAGKVYLWQEAQANLGEQELRLAFESFLAARDWWLERLDKERSGSQMLFPDIAIRP